jgi:hypothetical protein
MMVENFLDISNSGDEKHPKCKGYKTWTDCGYEYDCEYGSILSCEECKYGHGRKDPEARCNVSHFKVLL